MMRAHFSEENRYQTLIIEKNNTVGMCEDQNQLLTIMKYNSNKKQLIQFLYFLRGRKAGTELILTHTFT